MVLGQMLKFLFMCFEMLIILFQKVIIENVAASIYKEEENMMEQSSYSHIRTC